LSLHGPPTVLNEFCGFLKLKGRLTVALALLSPGPERTPAGSWTPPWKFANGLWAAALLKR